MDHTSASHGAQQRGRAKTKKRPSPTYRVKVLIGIICVFTILLPLRLIDLQVVRASMYAKVAEEFRVRHYVLHAKRGDILDSTGSILATSVERYNVGVNQKEVAQFREYDDDGNLIGTGAAAAAHLLAPILKMDEAELGGILLGGPKKSTFAYVKKDISPETWREIAKLGIRGIEPEQYMKREYPNGYVAGNILGYLGETAEDRTPTGQAGIEKSFNKELTGKDGSLTVEVVRGAVLPNGTHEEVPAVNGDNIHLTINRDLQEVAQEAVDNSVQRHHAEWGAAVVIEIGTGRVLALADSSTPNPGDLGATSSSNWGSRAVSAPVEPGSSGKLVTFSAAINEKTVTPMSVFDVPSELTMPNGETIHDNEVHAHEKMTVAGIMAKSYNTGLVQIGDTISDKVRYNYMLAYGLGKRTGIELPAESAGILRPPNTWDKRTHYTTMFGQAYALTTLQLGQIAATIGNKGVYVPLHIVDGYDTANGYHQTVVGESHRVITAESAKEMLDMMQGVTDKRSTGWLAAVKGYNVAGKTGTAQVVDSHGNLTKRVGTFAGVIPAENPQIAIAVVVFNGAGAGYGGDVAAPVFSQVATFAMRQMRVPPSSVPLVNLAWYPDGGRH